MSTFADNDYFVSNATVFHPTSHDAFHIAIAVDMGGVNRVAPNGEYLIQQPVALFDFVGTYHNCALDDS
jgi:hypothetical protein